MPTPTPTSAASWTARAPMAWMAACAILMLAASLGRLVSPAFDIADLFLKEQDWPAAVIAGAFMLALRFLPLPPLAFDLARRPARVAAGAAACAFAVALIGWPLVCRSYPLSMDEFLATFDAAILREGHLSATVPPAWRAFTTALQPQFMVTTADHSLWVSDYLPVNAMILSLVGRLGTPALAGAAWAVLAIAALCGVARRLWPQRPDAAVLAVLLLASSSQFLVTAMTPYAMSAHLALNMAWLWLFLRGGRLGCAGAAAVGFLACGLHQVVFHPLFVAPFVLQLWWERRWRSALFYTAAYAAIGLFWISYWAIALPVEAAGSAGSMGAGNFPARVAALVAKVDPAGWSLMAKNLLRFLLWQNPLAVALAAMGAVAAVRTRGPLRALLAGMVLTVLAMTVLMPSQGHGWGYRYLHGFLGGVCLVAASAWVALTPAPEDRARGWSLALASVAFSLVVLLPLRGWQVRNFIGPYAAAARAIAQTDAKVVAVDPTGMFYAGDLVRNDPWLRRRPRVIDLVTTSADELSALCASNSVAVFDQAGGFGLKPADYPAPILARVAAKRASMARQGCGEAKVKP